MRNALLPVVYVCGHSRRGSLIGGSMLVETVFAWPGIGRLAYRCGGRTGLPVAVGGVHRAPRSSWWSASILSPTVVYTLGGSARRGRLMGAGFCVCDPSPYLGPLRGPSPQGKGETIFNRSACSASSRNQAHCWRCRPAAGFADRGAAGVLFPYSP